MSVILKKIIGKFSSDKTQIDGGNTAWDIKNEKYTNHFTDVQILHGHSDIVTSLLRIDDTRFASASDDASVIIWNSETGEKLLKLDKHTLRVTCMLLLDSNILVTGSADKSIILWNLDNGECIKCIKNTHKGSVRCLILLASGDFCSGGNDEFLCIWSREGELKKTIERRDSEHLNCLLPISNDIIVTGSNASMIYAYSIEKEKCVSLLSSHREAVQCLVDINEQYFVSGSLDGRITLWDKNTHKYVKNLSDKDVFINKDKMYTNSVNHMEKIGDNYLAACIGNNFCIFDVSKKECIVNCNNAHSSNVLKLISLYNGKQIITGSEDSNIRIWGNKLEGTKGHMLQRSNSSSTLSPSQKSPFEHFGHLGDLWCHYEKVCALIPLTQFSFASGSNDGTIIIWRDGRVESEKRNNEAIKFLSNYISDSDDDEMLSDEFKDLHDALNEEIANDNEKDSPPQTFSLFQSNMYGKE